MELLIAKGANIEAKCGRWGSPSLVFASAIGRRDIAELLLSKGVDIEAKNSDGMTPLLMAVYSGKAKVAVLLLSKGADTEARTYQGRPTRKVRKLHALEQRMESYSCASEKYLKHRMLFKADREALRRNQTLEMERQTHKESKKIV